MNWTYDRPTLPGYYWHRAHDECPAAVVLVSGGRVCWPGHDGTDPLPALRGQWFGPLSPPSGGVDYLGLPRKEAP